LNSWEFRASVDSIVRPHLLNKKMKINTEQLFIVHDGKTFLLDKRKVRLQTAN
jgi:hypothetical protein